MASHRRIIFDISSTAQSLGPPVGILRREREIAGYALAKRPDILFSFFDKPTSSFFAVERDWAERLIRWDHALDTTTAQVRRQRKGMARLRPSRYLLTVALERRRLMSRRSQVHRLVDLGQRLIWLPGRLPPPFTDHQHQRLGVVPRDLALAQQHVLGANDLVISVGNDWIDKDAEAIARLKRRFGFGYVVMCHDLIPLQFPDFFPARFPSRYLRHWLTTFSIADRILVNSRTIERDIRGFSRIAGLEVGEIVLVQPGCDLVRADQAATLPAGLEAGKFALFVGTIEPRKGHAMLIEVWRRLLAEGIPQRSGFKLVFAGRPGWKVDEVLRQIADANSFQGTLFHFAGIDDRGLAGLYRGAAFCLLPSLYEGFGVPIVEAFAHGKAVIASDGGALPETVGPFSPCLPARDDQAWFATIRRWIQDHGARAPYEAKIRASFAHPRWSEATAGIFDAAMNGL